MNGTSSPLSGTALLAEVQWCPRPHPLPASGAAGWGSAGVHLAERLLSRPDAWLAHLSGVASGDLLLLAGPAEALPWCDGVLYLGRDPLAPSLLIPTTLTTSVPIALFERAIHMRSPETSPPIAVIPGRSAFVSLSPATPLGRVQLASWLRQHRGADQTSGVAASREEF